VLQASSYVEQSLFVEILPDRFSSYCHFIQISERGYQVHSVAELSMLNCSLESAALTNENKLCKYGCYCHSLDIVETTAK